VTCIPFDSDNGTTGFVCMPNLSRQAIRRGICPDCGKETRFISFYYEWYGSDATCLRCGRRWCDGEWMPLPFTRFARRDNIEQAKAAWRRNRDVNRER